MPDDASAEPQRPEGNAPTDEPQASPPADPFEPPPVEPPSPPIVGPIEATEPPEEQPAGAVVVLRVDPVADEPEAFAEATTEPVAPVLPVSPVAPVAPVAPVLPVAPVAPVAPPEAPVLPVAAPPPPPPPPPPPAPARPTPSTPQRDQPISVMLLGAGELSRELVTAFQRLGALVTTVDQYADAPAHKVADRALHVNTSDADELTALVEREQPDVVVNEAAETSGKPVVAHDALAAVAERGLAGVVPTVRAGRLGVDREALRRLASDQLGLPTAPFWFAGSVDELQAVVAHAGFPLIVRPVTGPRGRGESVILREEDVVPAWERATVSGGRFANTRVIAETLVDIDCEVTVLAVRSASRTGSRVQFCEPIGHRMHDGDVMETWQPQSMSPRARDAAKSIAARIVNTLGGRGVYGVELLVKGDEVYFSDVHPCLGDSGLVTLRTQRLSQFELHARAILGLPLDTIMVTPGAAEVLYSHPEPANGDDDARTERATRALSDALTVPESDVRVFGHQRSYPGRRLGVALATAANVTIARERAGQVAAALRKFW